MNDLPEITGDAAVTEIRTCWSQIGVHGDGTCPELQKFVHCRNCPVYSIAGVQLLNRPLPADYRREWTEHFARKKKTAAPAKVSAVLFRIADEWLAMPTPAFQEVAERRPIHSLPHRRRSAVLGLVNVRGELLICVSLGRLLGLENAAIHQTGRSCLDRLLVVNWEGSRVAFPVDDIHGILRFQEQDLKDPPATLSKSNLSFTKGVLPWQGRFVGFLDPSVLFPALDRSLA